MNYSADLEVYDTVDAAARAGAESFVACATEAVSRKGRFDVALSGGDTPKPMYRLFAEAPFRDRVPWAQVHLFWGDDRAVVPSHSRSNFKMARDAFIASVPIPASNVHRMQGELPVQEAVRLYCAELEGHFGANLPVFDLIHLGIGTDGHTASLFPGGAELDIDDRTVAASADPARDEPRITLTFPVINAARRIEILVLEPEKTRLIAEIFRGDSNAKRYPAERIAPKGQLVWMLSRAAARDLLNGDLERQQGA